MGFGNVASMADYWETGKVWRQNWHKLASPITSGSGFLMDLSMAAGTPKYNAYVGNQQEFTPMVGASNFGINAGAGGDKWIGRYNINGAGVANTSLPANVMLLDYVGFYPLVDMDNTDYQDLDNATYTSRYASGLRCMVVTTTPQIAVSPIRVLLDYIDSKGVAATASFFVAATPSTGCINCFSSAVAGVGSFSPFVPLGVGTIDMQRLVGVTMLGSAGGFCAFVLVRPVLECVVYDSITPSELEFPRNGPMPYVPTGAYLNHIFCPVSGGTVSGVTRGTIAFVKDA